MTPDSPKGPACNPPEQQFGLACRVYAAAHDIEPHQVDRTDGGYEDVARELMRHSDLVNGQLAGLLGISEDSDDGDIADALAQQRSELERLTAELALYRERDALTRKALQVDGDGPLQFAALIVRQHRDRAVAEVSRLREQLAAQPPPDLVERAAIWLFRAKTSRLKGADAAYAQQTWDDVLDVRDTDAWKRYAEAMLIDLGWGVSSSEVEAPQPQEMTHHKVSVRRYNELWWQAKCPECDLLLYRKSQQEAADWKDQHEADTLVPQLQANSKLEQNLEEGRPSGSERLAPRPVSNLALWTDDDEIVWEVKVVDIRQVATIRLVDEPTEVREVLVRELSPLPRVWHKGDPEPDDHPPVMDRHGDVWTHVPGTFEWSSPETQNCSWSYMARKWSPLTEVVSTESQDAAQAARSEATPKWVCMGESHDADLLEPCAHCVPSPSLRKEGEDSD